MNKVEFVIGRSGSGKTTYCYEAIEAALKEESFEPLVLLVPEQFNLQTQKDLAKRLYPGLLRAEVMSFNTLAREVFKEVGKTEATVIEDLERMIILKRVIEAHKNEIIFYKKNMNNTGFIEAINRLITVLEQSGVGVEQLSEMIASKEAPQLFRSKLTDIQMLYDAFETYLGAQFVTIEKNMTLLAHSVMKSKKLEKTWLWIDGFYGFTHTQLLIIKELMKRVKGITITLPMDKPYTRTDRVRVSYPFYESIQMLQKLMGICEEQNLSYNVQYVSRPKEEKKEELGYLEQEYLKPYVNAYSKANQAVHLQTYPSRAEEVERVAKEIVSLVMERGYRYHDIAVIVGDLVDYKTLLEGTFKEYNIPYFLDMKRNIHTNSLVAALEGVLAVLTCNYSYKSMMGLLRTQMFSIPVEAIDQVENYLLAYGIKGKKKWAEPWGFDQRNEEKQAQINITREAILAPIQNLEARIKATKIAGKNKVVDLTKALYGFLEDIGAYSKLHQTIEKNKAVGNRLLEIENTQIWGKIMEVFERLVDILGEEELSLMTYRRILETSFSYVKMGVIPPAQDQVLIGSVDRTRLPRLKACFILGTNEGVIPKVDETTPIFSDMDKAALGQMCKEDKGPKGRLNDLIIDQPLYGAQFSIYTMLTRATEKLFVSAAMADENGKPLRVSLVYYKLKKLFGEMPKREADLLDEVYRPLPTFGYLGNQLRQYVEGRLEEESWKDLVSWYAEKEEWKDRLKGLTDYLFYTNQQHYLKEETVHLLYGKKLDTSISKLETFRQCACCYFMRYGIKAEERRLLNFDRAKVGTLFHSALEQYPKELSLMNTTWTTATREEMHQGVKKATAYAVEQVSAAQRETNRFQFIASKVEKMTSRAIHALAAHLKNGTFEPMGYEINFGEGKGFPPIEIAVDEERSLLVTGQIDRVDVYYKDDNNQYIKILDYKSGQKNFNLLEVYYGLQLQLLLYLDAYLKKHHSYEAGGVFYFHINNPYVSYKVGMDEIQLQENSLKQFKLSGLAVDEPEIIAALDQSGTGSTIPVSLNKDGSIKKGSSVASKDQFKLLEHHIIETIRGLGEELLEGKVSAKPYRLKGKDPCTYCIYHTICQFSEEQVDNCYDHLEQLSKEEVWEKLEKEGK